MYRKLFLLMALIFTSHALFSQSDMPKDSSGKIVYTEVISVDNIDAKQLYSKAKLFYSYLQQVMLDVSKNEDETTGQVIYNFKIKTSASMIEGFKGHGYVEGIFKISVKDNRYKYIINELTYSDLGKSGKFPLSIEFDDNELLKKNWFYIRVGFNSDMKKAIASLKEKMAVKPDDF